MIKHDEIRIRHMIETAREAGSFARCGVLQKMASFYLW